MLNTEIHELYVHLRKMDKSKWAKDVPARWPGSGSRVAEPVPAAQGTGGTTGQAPPPLHHGATRTRALALTRMP